jgi:hypothetical protein
LLHFCVAALAHHPIARFKVCYIWLWQYTQVWSSLRSEKNLADHTLCNS